MSDNPKSKPAALPSRPPVSPEELERAFPGGFSVRDEANALTAYAFRNGYLEQLHAGKSSPLTADLSLSRITNDEMKQLMIEASEKLENKLRLRESDPAAYRKWLHRYAITYCRRWNR